MDLLKDLFVATAIYLHIGLAMVGLLGILVLAWAYRMPPGEPKGSAVWYFSSSICDLAVAIGVAINVLGFWVLWRVYFSPTTMMFSDGWPLIAIGMVFDVLFLRGLYRGLKAVQLSLHERLPEAERHLWPWWLAWMYPERLSIRRLYY